MARRAAGKSTPTAYVWNNVLGWGREDAAYRLANAGFDVVLCNATHLYFDLACEKHPDEPGYYWAGFVDTRAPFELVPLDVFKNADQDGMGRPVPAATLADRQRLTEQGHTHILGIQGQLWAENLRSPAMLEYMAFPRIIALGRTRLGEIAGVGRNRRCGRAPPADRRRLESICQSLGPDRIAASGLL